MQVTYTNEFSKNNCYIAAMASKMIYPPDDWQDKGLNPNGPIKGFADLLGMRFKVYTVDNHRAAIVQNARFAIIVYCGTNDWQDLFTDLNYFQEQIPGTSAMVHRGVNDGYYQLSRIMTGDLNNIWRSGKNWIITGHSLGGGLATRSLVGLRNPNGHCYTFGSLRVGNMAMYNTISTAITRVVNGNDLVSHLPFKRMIISGCEYNHKQNNLIYLNYDGTITEGNRTLWGHIKEDISSVSGDIMDKDLIPDNMEDHSIADYVRILQQWDGA